MFNPRYRTSRRDAKRPRTRPTGSKEDLEYVGIESNWRERNRTGEKMTTKRRYASIRRHDWLQCLRFLFNRPNFLFVVSSCFSQLLFLHPDSKHFVGVVAVVVVVAFIIVEAPVPHFREGLRLGAWLLGCLAGGRPQVC
jgi:hypothetical protein